MSGILAVAVPGSTPLPAAAVTKAPAATTAPSMGSTTASTAAAATTATASDTQRQLRLVNAAQQFEGMLLEQILKPLQRSQDGGFGTQQDDPDNDRDTSLDTMSSYGTEAVATAIASVP
jgi:hypothetical protein